MPSCYYVAVILSRSSSTEHDYVPLYEESFVLVQAASDDEAVEKAKGLARTAETEYDNVHGERISWHAELSEVSEALSAVLEDGSEFYARFFRNIGAYEALGVEDFSKRD